MSVRSPRLLAGAVALGSIAAFAIAGEVPEGCHVAQERVAEDPEDDPEEDLVVCTEPTFLADASEVKAGNVTAADEQPSAVLVAEEPTESVADGAGGGFLGTSLLQLNEPNEYATGLTIGGQSSGPLDSLDVTLHGFHTGYLALPVSPSDPTGSDPNPTNPITRQDAQFYVDLVVDGATLMNNVEIESLMAPAETANAAETFRFRITGISDVFEPSSPMTAESSPTIELRVTPRFINTEPVIVFVYGTTEVPSSVVLNPDPGEETPEGLPVHEL